jgi:hypothetical protein
MFPPRSTGLVVARHTPFLKGALDLPGIKQVQY